MTAPTDMTNCEDVMEERLAEILGQLSERARQGQEIDITQYVKAYPQLEERLKKLLPSIQVLADLGLSAVDDLQIPATSHRPKQAMENVLGDYRILEEIGRGGMRIVYEAEQLSIGRKVALKVLPFAAVLDDRQIKRFKNEVRAAGSLEHPNIVPIYAVGECRGVHYYAMTLIHGQNLSEVIAELRTSSGAQDDQPEQPVADQENNHSETSKIVQAVLSTVETSQNTRSFFRSVARLGVQASQALQYAHENGVLHRDIKPANLMLDAKGKLWITDFGLARLESDANMTMTGDLVGTLRYMSPEQAMAGRIEVDRRSDVYSLGVTLYELLTLRHAYPGDTRQELLKQIVFEEPLTPRRINGAIPEDLETIVLKAMAKSPADRYLLAQDLADDLQRFIEDKPIHARRPTVGQRLAKWSRRHKSIVWISAAAMAAVLVVIAVGSALIADKESDRRIAAENATDLETELRQQAEASRNKVAALLGSSYYDRGHSLCEQGEIGRGMLWLAHGLKTVPPTDSDQHRALRSNLSAWSVRLHHLEQVFSIRTRSARLPAVQMASDSFPPVMTGSCGYGRPRPENGSRRFRVERIALIVSFTVPTENMSRR